MTRIRSSMAIPAVLAALGLITSNRLAQPALAQDITLHEKVTSAGGMTGAGGGRSSTTTHYLSSKAMKVESSDGHDSIIRLDLEKVVSIDHKKKTYSETTFKQLQDMLSQASAQLDKSAGENKEAMEAMRRMMGNTATSFSVEKLGPGETIAGYRTERYLVKGPMEMEISATPDLKVPAVYYDIMKLTMPRSPLFDLGKMYDEMKKVNGIGLKTVMTMRMMGREMKTTTEVTSVEKGTIPPEKFEVPAGYALQPFNPRER